MMDNETKRPATQNNYTRTAVTSDNDYFSTSRFNTHDNKALRERLLINNL